jgi:hypothetical protein
MTLSHLRQQSKTDKGAEMRCWRFGFSGYGFSPFPFGFHFYGPMHFPGREKYLRILERYKEELEAELREVDKEIEELKGKD